MDDFAYTLRRDLIRTLGEEGGAELSACDAYVELFALLARHLWPEGQRFEPRSVLIDAALLTPLFHLVLAHRGAFEREHLLSYGRLGALVQPGLDSRRTPGVRAPLPPSGAGLSFALGWSGAGPVTCVVDERAFKTATFDESLSFWDTLPHRPITLLLCAYREQSFEALKARLERLGRRVSSFGPQDALPESFDEGIYVFYRRPTFLHLKASTPLTRQVKEELLEELRLRAGKEEPAQWQMNFSLASQEF